MMKRILVVAAALMLSFASSALAANIRVSALECCYLSDPVGVESPTFGWKLTSSVNGAIQTAWQVQVSKSAKVSRGDVWDSGKVDSNVQFGIVPDIASLESATTYYWRVRVWDADGKPTAWTSPATFTTGLLGPDAWTAKWIMPDWSKASNMPQFRKEIVLSGKVRKAIAYVCGLGASDLYINGEYADETRLLDPAQTNYEQYALYSAMDVTSKLQSGRNCLGVMLYDGWFDQKEVFADFSYGDPMLRVQLVVEYSNGRKEVFGTDESWQWKEGPVVFSNIYSGERYDARLASSDWCTVDSRTTGWQDAVVADASIGMYSQIMPAIRTHETLSAVRMWKTSRGTWIYDFGTNNTADIKVNGVSLPAGTKFTIRTAEEKYPSGDSLDFRSTGTGVVPVQTDEYIFAGTGKETWMPRGTYHGFRFAELAISDPSAVPSQDWLQAVLVHTDLAVKGTFASSDAQLNRLHEMALRTLQGNIVGVPMDCPTREKCGWLGDAHAYIKMQLMNYDADNFLFKYLDDIESGANIELKNTLHHMQKNRYFYNADKASGIPFMIAPGKRLCGVASPDWGTAVVQLPWHLYLYDGNVQALEKYYGMMKQWTDYVTGLSVNHIVYQGLGDWCPPYGNIGMDTQIDFTSSAFHYYDVSIMEQVAGILGKTEDQAEYAAEKAAIKKAMIDKYFNPVIKTFNTQTANSMALDLGLCPDGMEAEVARSLVVDIQSHRNTIYTGIFGLTRIGSALSRNGQAKAAFDLFTKKGKNSFEWMWKGHDATTLWEVLPIYDDYVTPTLECSHCHPMQAGFDIWFYEDVAGIRPVADAPGFRKILLAPAWDIDLKSAKASVESRYGTITSDWKKTGNTVEWKVSIPVGTSADLVLPEGRTITYNSGDYTLTFEL